MYVRITATITVAVTALVTELYIRSRIVPVTEIEYLQFLEWQRIMKTIMVATPLAAFVFLIVIWWEPLKQHMRNK